MEVSKPLLDEILFARNKMNNAIREHQIHVGKLNDDPNNTDILDRIREIQLQIITISRWQKQMVQRLRKDVRVYETENGARVCVATLLGLNNNNNITNNNESSAAQSTTRPVSLENGASVPILNGHAESRGSSKEDYEEIVRNGDVASPLCDDASIKDRLSSSVSPASGVDEVMEVCTENGPAAAAAEKVEEKKEKEEDSKPAPQQMTAEEQLSFMGQLGLITKDRLVELQRKRTERKRRSTANSHFVYNNWEMPTKRKRHAYLQSLGSAPQTRQTTARLNGPSPPPKNSTSSNNRPTSAAAARAAKSLIQATTARPTVSAKPAILRNGDGKPTKEKSGSGSASRQETERKLGGGQQQQQQQTSTGKTVHIPGLPSGLTIERIENDSTVCVACRNPGTLTVCEYCSAKFHVSCHTSSPASSCYCPRCAARFRGKGLSSSDLEILLEMKSIKKDKEQAAAAYAPRAFVKAGEDAEVHKAPAGLRKADAAKSQQQHLTAAALGINQLPSSTFLIPIADGASAIDEDEDDDAAPGVADAVDEPLVVSADAAVAVSTVLGSATATVTAAPAASSRLGPGFAEQQQQPQQQQQQSSILLSQLSQPSGESRLLRQAKEIVSHGQSLLVIGKLAGQPAVGQRRWSSDRPTAKPKPGLSVLDYEWSARSSSTTSSSSSSSASVSAESHPHPRSKAPARIPARIAVGKPDGNYVTVEVICQNDDDDDEDDDDDDDDDEDEGEAVEEDEDDDDGGAEHSAEDCVYISEASSGMPDVIELESPRADEAKQQEPEVHNVSSGSSCVQALDSPRRASEASSAHLETPAKSPGARSASAASNSDREQPARVTAPSSPSASSSSSSSTSSFLGSIFPGRYGYKIDVVDVDTSTGTGNSSASDDEATSDGPAGERHHVKLEEAHLPAPPGLAELVAVEEARPAAASETESSSQASNSSWENESNRMAAVPDNKSDDAEEHEDKDKGAAENDDAMD